MDSHQLIHCSDFIEVHCIVPSMVIENLKGTSTLYVDTIFASPVDLLSCLDTSKSNGFSNLPELEPRGVYFATENLWVVQNSRRSLLYPALFSEIGINQQWSYRGESKRLG